VLLSSHHHPSLFGLAPPGAETPVFGLMYRPIHLEATAMAVSPAPRERILEFSDGVSYRMHLDCATIWQAECERRTVSG